MNDSVMLFDSSDKLSPNYIHEETIKNEISSCVISYCYGGIVKAGGQRNYILKTKPKEAKKLSMDYMNHAQDEIYKSSMIEALKIKYENPVFRQELKDTFPKKLMFGPSNFIGSILTEFRDQIIITDSETEEKNKKIVEKQKINNIYFVFKTLEGMITSGSDDLLRFKGKNIEEIAEVLKIQQPTIFIPYASLTKDMKVCLSNPTLTSDYIRQKYIELYNKEVIVNEIEEVYNAYTKKIISKQVEKYILTHPNIPKASVRTKLMAQLDAIKNVDEVKTRIHSLWILNMVDVPDMIIRHKYSEEEVEEIKHLKILENLTIKKPVESVSKKIEIQTQPSVDYFITDDNINSTYFTYFIDVGGFVYPTVMHYVFSTIVNTFVMNKSESHSLIMLDRNKPSREYNNYKNGDELIWLYNSIKDRHIFEILTSRAKQSLNTKFKEPTMAGVLVASYPKNLIYNDYSDPILGSGKTRKRDRRFEGQNVIGQIMMEIRQTLIDKGIQPIIEDPPSKVKFSEIIQNPEELEWLTKKVDELLYIIKAFMSYEKFKYSLEERDIDVDDVDFVLETLMSSCSKLEKFLPFDKTRMPEDFSNKVKEFFLGNFNIQKSGIIRVWKYVLFLKNSMYMVQGFDRKKFSDEVKRFEGEYLLSKKDKVCKGGLYGEDSKVKNCVSEAFKNIFSKLEDYSKEKKVPFALEEPDLAFAYELIVNTDKFPDMIEKESKDLPTLEKIVKKFKPDRRYIEHLSKCLNHLTDELTEDKNVLSRLQLLN